MKKIGILTQPLHNNYGGLLQAYALQRSLQLEGYDVITVDFSTEDIDYLLEFKAIIKASIQKYLFRKNIKSIFPLTKEQKRLRGKETNRFVAENIKKTQKLLSIEELDYLNSYQFDAFVVGSDQVWRPKYSPGLSAFFLEFLQSDTETKRVAYAASFGVDNCDEYSEKDIQHYSTLLRKFHAVGVREDSAVALCEKHFKRTAEHVLDPTLLLEKEEYVKLIEADGLSDISGNMMVYVLDKSKEKEVLVNRIGTAKKLNAFEIMPDKSEVFPPVTMWLKGFLDSDFVVTDSFHGVVFSILFNKQFLAIGNLNRGLARFSSILKIFNLERRLIVGENTDIESLLNEEINYDEVNKIIQKEKRHSLAFLKCSLEN